MPDKIRLTRRAFMQMAATVTALSAFSHLNTNAAIADTTAAQIDQPPAVRRVPVGLL
jgi:hypothetical protein